LWAFFTVLLVSGYFCSNASDTATPVLGVMGGPCDPGFYCPTGSADKTQCDPGTYCQTALLSAPTGNCTAGRWNLLFDTKGAVTLQRMIERMSSV